MTGIDLPTERGRRPVPPALLDVAGLDAGYGRIPVLHGLSLTVGHEGAVGLFGPHGHGKTTLLRVLAGLLRPSAGEIRFEGQSLLGARPREIVARGLIHVPQGNRLFPDLTIAECLGLGAYAPRARSHAAANRARVLSIFPRIAERWHQRVRTLSGGERQMVSIGVALMGHPRLLLLDEPTLGLAPKIRDELCAAILEISRGGVSLLIVEQDVGFLLELAQRLYFVNAGTAAAEILPGEGLDRPDALQPSFRG